MDMEKPWTIEDKALMLLYISEQGLPAGYRHKRGQIQILSKFLDISEEEAEAAFKSIEEKGFSDTMEADPEVKA